MSGQPQSSILTSRSALESRRVWFVASPEMLRRGEDVPRNFVAPLLHLKTRTVSGIWGMPSE